MTRIATAPPPPKVMADREKVMADREKSSEGWAWLRDNPIPQPTHRVFASLVLAWGASGSAAIFAALVICFTGPILGWFIAPPTLLVIALKAASIWVAGVFVILGAWAVTVATVAFVSSAVRLHLVRRP